MLSKIGKNLDALLVKAQIVMKRFVQDEQGDFGIAQIGAVVAVLVILGAIVGVLTNEALLGEFVADVWGWLTDWVTNLLS